MARDDGRYRPEIAWPRHSAPTIWSATSWKARDWASFLAATANLGQSFYSPELDAYPESYRDPHGVWAPTRLSYYSIAYNTKLVPDEVAPKSYADLLDPRWTGKMAWRVGTGTGVELFLTSLRQAWGDDKAMAYFKKLAQQKIVNFASGSARTLVDRVIAGDYSIAINIYAHHALISEEKGAPVKPKLLDPTPSSTGSMVIPHGVRHPYAALLFADFLLSKQGQGMMGGTEYFPVRPDVPAAVQLRAVVPSVAGVPENFTSSPTTCRIWRKRVPYEDLTTICFAEGGQSVFRCFETFRSHVWIVP